MNLYVFTKDAGDIQNQLTPVLNAGETVTGITIDPVTPADTNAPTLTISSGVAVPIMFKVTGGSTGITYGFPLKIQTDQRLFVITVAVNVLSDALAPYTNADPDSYQDLVGSIQAGKTAMAKMIMTFPPSFDPSGGYVVWDILDATGTIYASGNAFDYKIVASGIANTVIARSLINVPSNIPPSPDNPYQLRYTVTIGQQIFPYYESLQVDGLVAMQLGAQDQVELLNDPATMSLVTASLYQNYVLELYADGTLIASMAAQPGEQVVGGYYVAGTIDTSQLVASTEPYQVIWKFWNNATANQVFREGCALWIVTSSMVQAIEDVKSKVNKARQTLYGTPDSQFPSTEIMKWLRRGKDAFNGWGGQFTSFTMTNAKGVVREYWLLCAEKSALEAQYMLEGEKAFNFSGAAISLDVDRTSYLDNLASKIQSDLDTNLTNIKKNLIIKNQISGDGSSATGDGNFSALNGLGAIGSVGVTITPVSLYGSGLGVYGWNYAGIL